MIRKVILCSVLHQVMYKREVQRAVQVAIEVVRGDERLQRDGDEGSKSAFLGAQHGSPPEADEAGTPTTRI